MSKKHGFLHGLFGGMFDMDGDGEEDQGEQWLGFQIMDDIMSEDEADKDAEDFGAAAFDIPHESADEPWRLTCEDGLEYGVDPGDYETEEEYEDALKEAKNSWPALVEQAIAHPDQRSMTLSQERRITVKTI